MPDKNAININNYLILEKFKGSPFLNYMYMCANNNNGNVNNNNINDMSKISARGNKAAETSRRE